MPENLPKTPKFIVVGNENAKNQNSGISLYIRRKMKPLRTVMALHWKVANSFEDKICGMWTMRTRFSEGKFRDCRLVDQTDFVAEKNLEKYKWISLHDGLSARGHVVSFPAEQTFVNFVEFWTWKIASDDDDFTTA